MKCHIFRGLGDAVISEKDFQKLMDLMNKDNLKVYELEEYSHLDYIWGKNAHEHIYSQIVQILEK